MVKPYIMVERSFNLECVLKLDTWGHKPRASKVSMVGEAVGSAPVARAVQGRVGPRGADLRVAHGRPRYLVSLAVANERSYSRRPCVRCSVLPEIYLSISIFNLNRPRRRLCHADNALKLGMGPFQRRSRAAPPAPMTTGCLRDAGAAGRTTNRPPLCGAAPGHPPSAARSPNIKHPSLRSWPGVFSSRDLFTVVCLRRPRRAVRGLGRAFLSLSLYLSTSKH